MDGITILNTFTHASYSSWIIWWQIIGIALMLVGVGLLLGSQTYSQFLVGVSLSAISVIALICGLVLINKRSIETTRYECIVDETVNANDLYDKYDVIERRGEIWVLEEKDNDE